MSTDRRKFLEVAAVTSGAFVLSDARSSLAASLMRPDARDDAPGKAAVPLNILILGGTGFTGPEQVNYALGRGHKVTLFNRNQTRPDMFKGGSTSSSATSANPHSWAIRDQGVLVPSTRPRRA